MRAEESEMKKFMNNQIDRRNFLGKSVLTGAGLAVSGALPGSAQTSKQEGRVPSSSKAGAPGRRMLGKLEVSAVGMGVQNMHRKYDTSVPYRPDMIAILRAAYDRGIAVAERKGDKQAAKEMTVFAARIRKQRAAS